MTTARILIEVPRNRLKTGTLTLFGHTGDQLFSCKCLARSVGHPSNPTRDPLKYRGDTPVGKYALTFCTALAAPIPGIGSLWIGLDPDDFYDTQARKAELNGRRGLGIHGGRGDALLKPTHGCVRLADSDMRRLARFAGKLRFPVEIREA
jgi:hypothetical protein